MSTHKAFFWASLSSTILSSPSLATETGAIVTIPVRRAIVGTLLHRAVKPIEAFVSASAGSILTHTVVLACWRTDLVQAVNSSKPRLAIADPIKTVAIVVAVAFTQGDVAELARKARVASTHSIITVLQGREGGREGRRGCVSEKTKTRKNEQRQRKDLPSIPSHSHTHTQSHLILLAASRTHTKSTIITHVSHITITREVMAHSMPRTSVGTDGIGAVNPRVPKLTETRGVGADAVIRAILGASSNGTIQSHPSSITHTCQVHTSSCS